jgi:hypothetical protein
MTYSVFVNLIARCRPPQVAVWSQDGIARALHMLTRGDSDAEVTMAALAVVVNCLQAGGAGLRDAVVDASVPHLRVRPQLGCPETPPVRMIQACCCCVCNTLCSGQTLLSRWKAHPGITARSLRALALCAAHSPTGPWLVAADVRYPVAAALQTHVRACPTPGAAQSPQLPLSPVQRLGPCYAYRLVRCGQRVCVALHGVGCRVWSRTRGCLASFAM